MSCVRLVALILDDALSAVDTYTEEEILSRLRPLLRQRPSKETEVPSATWHPSCKRSRSRSVPENI